MQALQAYHLQYILKALFLQYCLVFACTLAVAGFSQAFQHASRPWQLLRQGHPQGHRLCFPGNGSLLPCFLPEGQLGMLHQYQWVEPCHLLCAPSLRLGGLQRS